jgi:hypothetical protein
MGIFMLTRRAGTGLACISGCTAAALLYPLGTSPFALLTCVALAIWAAHALLAPGQGSLAAFGAGTLGALAIGFRPDAALLVLAPALVVLRGQRRWRSWIVGLGVGVVPLAASIAISPMGLLDDVLLGRVLRGAGQSRLPLPTDTSERLVLVGYVFGVLVSVAAAAMTRDRLHVVLGSLAVLSLPLAFQRTDVTHFLYGSLLAVCFVPQALASLMRSIPRRGVAAGLTCLLLITATTLPILLGPMGRAQRSLAAEAETIRHGGRQLREAPAYTASLRRLLGVLDAQTTPSTRLFVFDSDLTSPIFTDLVVYYLMPDTRQVARNLEINPGLTNTPKARLAEDLENADIAVLVTVPPERRRAVLPHQRPGPSEPAETLRQLFCHVATVDFYEVYRRCR